VTNTSPPEDCDALLRGTLEPWRGCDDRKSALIFAFDITLYLTLILCAATAGDHAVAAAAGIAAGLVTIRLASIAHDAAHRIFVTSSRANKWIARIAFFPALQPLATWEVAHNVIHHSWTSIRGKDYVWIPLSLEEYRSASLLRRALERIYRSPFGHGFYYFIELWWKRVLLPSLKLSDIPRRSQRADVLLTAAFLLLWLTAVAALRLFLSLSVWEGLLYAVCLPVATWFWGFGFVLYVQHTHPNAKFFCLREKDDFYRRQLAASTHAEFPRPVNWLFHGVFEHTAHHLDVRIPFYRLPAAQKELNATMMGRNVHEQYTFRKFLETTRVCKLYDYDNGGWLDFQGNSSLRRRSEP